MKADHTTARDIATLTISSWGSVAKSAGVVPWKVVGPDGTDVEPVSSFLSDFTAQGNSAGSVRSYSYALLRWWRFLLAVDVDWSRVTSAEVRDFVLWLQQAQTPRRVPRQASAATVNTSNPVTGKNYPQDRYQPRTIRHSNAVLRTFYDFWIDAGEGPLTNPVVKARNRGQRSNAHHNPMLPFRPEGRIRYNPKVPKRQPRAMPDHLWIELFAAMKSNRDRAILALAISNAARANELLGIRGVDIDWGDQLVRVVRKGTRAQQWLPASPDAMVWLRLYLSEIGELDPNSIVWRTLRRRGGQHQVLNYDALRAMLRRANAFLGTNWSMHDLRHTCALRMVRDKRLSLRDVQVILGHKHLTTTQQYLEEDDHAVILRVLQYLSDRDAPGAAVPPPTARGYDMSDLDVLFAGGFS